ELIYACSFGVEGIVMIDFISQIKPNAKVVFLDTGLHFQETYALIDKVKAMYPRLNIELKKSVLTVEEQEEINGNNLWESEPDRCYSIIKDLPLKQTLTNATACLLGLRREQSSSRRLTKFFNKDATIQSIKICPLILWSWSDTWNYINQHQLPYNALDYL